MSTLAEPPLFPVSCAHVPAKTVFPIPGSPYSRMLSFFLRPSATLEIGGPLFATACRGGAERAVLLGLRADGTVSSNTQDDPLILSSRVASFDLPREPRARYPTGDPRSQP